MATKKNLTPKQELFVKEYLVDLNATQAAVRAGYSKKTANEQGARLLANVSIAECVQKGMDKRAKKVEVSAEYVLKKIVETVDRCSQAVPVEVFNHETKQMEETGEYKFEHNGVLKGCELLGKHLKLFTEKVEHSGTVTLEELLASSKDDDDDDD